MKSSVYDSEELRLCTGCSVCVGVCGTKAITIKLNNEGHYKPIVDEDKCIERNPCKKSCYRYDENPVQSDKYEMCYATVNKSEKQLKAPSSGAVSRVSMGECITRDYKVMGYAYDTKENVVKSIVISIVDELDQFYGSKYFQSLTTEGFDEVLKNRTEKKYAIFGAPCQIYGFSQTSKYKRKPDSYLLVDIFCHGCLSMKLWKSCLKYMGKRTGCSKYDKVVFRSKTHAWHEYCFNFVSESE